jgi:glutathione S-transferase
MPPRPALSKQLAISYRRIPVLAIGRDVFVDTSLIVNALERRFPASAGFGTVYPDRKGGSGRDTGLIKALATFYADRTVFPLATMLLPWDTLPEAFVKDRSSVNTVAPSPCKLYGLSMIL